jgi:hypothetical protein
MENNLKRGAALNLLTSRSRQAERSSDSEWTEVCRRIKDGRIVPVISNSLYLDSTFSALIEQAAQAGPDAGAPVPFPIKMRSENLLSQAWAEKIGYPLADTHELARVSQFQRARSKDDEEAKVSYLEFLKEALLAYAENLGVETKLLDDLYAQVHESSFADLVQALGFPRYPEGHIDPLRLLARLPLPIFLTTSPHDFIERALLAENKHPTSLYSYWFADEASIPDQSAEFKATVDQPLVYHLYGIEATPASIVLSEEDYFNFLVRVTQRVDTDRSPIPVKLRSILAASSLILLGYRLQDWDFRVIFRGVINPEQFPTRGFSMVLQLAPDQQFNITNISEARKYLETYFLPKQFNVEWGDAEGFVARLWNEWNKWRQGA